MIEKIKRWYKKEILELPDKDIKLNPNYQEKESKKRKMKKRINTLETENEMLKNIIKDELYKAFMKKLNDSESDKRYKEDNIRLRKQIKILKEIIREEKYGNY